jgi:L-fucose mutarotase
VQGFQHTDFFSSAQVLRSAGHGDIIAVVDCNFPAVEVATHTTTGTLVQLAGVSAPEAISAISSVCPVDFFVEDPLQHMSTEPGVEMPDLGAQVISDCDAAMARNSGYDISFKPVDRFAFYEKSRKAFAVIQTSERRPYGNFLIQKGVVGPDGKDLMP